MLNANPPKRLFFLLYLGLFLLLPYGVVHGEPSTNGIWQILETKYTLIRYHSWEDLKKFNSKVDYSPGSWSPKRLFAFTGSDTMPDELKKKVDALYERVQEILDMRKVMKKITINVYQNKKQLHAAYNNIYRIPCRLRAWYVYEYNTMYLRVDDVHEGIVAHEIAHSIIDHYLIVRPPRATAEILARYVDSHLFD